MNAFERANLDRLAAQSEEFKAIRDFILDDRENKIKNVLEDSIRLMVRILFEIHSGDLNKIKQELREDAELIKGLDLDKITNDEYKRQGTKLRARYDQDTQRKFWATVLRLEADHSRKINGAAGESDIGGNTD
jgi:CRISPR/Cas system type I-B associated protein Csh2 (Cas7 group RAMP superfamily)